MAKHIKLDRLGLGYEYEMVDEPLGNTWVDYLLTDEEDAAGGPPALGDIVFVNFGPVGISGPIIELDFDPFDLPGEIRILVQINTRTVDMDFLTEVRREKAVPGSPEEHSSKKGRKLLSTNNLPEPQETPKGALEWFQSNLSEGTLTALGSVSLIYVISSIIGLVLSVILGIVWGGGLIQIAALINASYLGIGYLASPAATESKKNRRIAQKSTGMLMWLPASAYLMAGGGEYQTHRKELKAVESKTEQRFTAEQVRQAQARHAFDLFYTTEVAMIPMGDRKAGYAWSVSAVPRQIALQHFPFLTEELIKDHAETAGAGEIAIESARGSLILDRGQYAQWLFKETANRELELDSSSETVFADLAVKLGLDAISAEVEQATSEGGAVVLAKHNMAGPLATAMFEDRKRQEAVKAAEAAADDEIIETKKQIEEAERAAKKAKLDAKLRAAEQERRAAEHANLPPKEDIPTSTEEVPKGRTMTTAQTEEIQNSVPPATSSDDLTKNNGIETAPLNSDDSRNISLDDGDITDPKDCTTSSETDSQSMESLSSKHTSGQPKNPTISGKKVKQNPYARRVIDVNSSDVP